MNVRVLTAAALLAAGSAVTAGFPALAQTLDAPPAVSGPQTTAPGDPTSVPDYNTWQAGWDEGQFDHNHVILGTVADFKAYRLQVSRPDGVTQMIDLKNGTTILPSGMTPMNNQRVAVIGYYSNGTFIANRVILHI